MRRPRGLIVIYRTEDRAIYDDLISSFRNRRERPASISDFILGVGKYFLGFPYAGHTLERRGRESLVINLTEFDCFTFAENCVVLAGLLSKGKTHFRNYAAELKRTRYRSGVIEGYSARLHYFSDWLYDNERKGVILDVTRRSGGDALRKNFNFMTRHREEYPALHSEKSYQEMGAVEKRLSRRILHYIPKAASGRIGKTVENGDLIALTTGIEGLDVVHVGLAVRSRSRIHLLHASEVEKKVVISDVTLCQYLSRRKTLTGIMVGRVTLPYQNDGSPSSA
jgi:hypothetical protein